MESFSTKENCLSIFHLDLCAHCLSCVTIKTTCASSFGYIITESNSVVPHSIPRVEAPTNFSNGTTAWTTWTMVQAQEDCSSIKKNRDEYECCFITKKRQSGISSHKGSCVLACGVWSSAVRCTDDNSMIPLFFRVLGFRPFFGFWQVWPMIWWFRQFILWSSLWMAVILRIRILKLLQVIAAIPDVNQWLGFYGLGLDLSF